MSDALGDDARLTRAGTRKDQNRTFDLFDGRSLLGVELHRYLV